MGTVMPAAASMQTRNSRLSRRSTSAAFSASPATSWPVSGVASSEGSTASGAAGITARGVSAGVVAGGDCAEAAAAAAAAAAAKKQGTTSNQVTTTGSGSATRYSGTFTWPLPGYTSASSAYGWRTHPIYGTRKFHKGEDIPAPTGAAIVAAASGTVTTAGWVSGYGNYTVINHGGGVMTAYGHQSAIYVSVGQTVSAGQTIGAVGSTGNSTGPHLHFEVYVNGATQNPMSYFS